MIACLDVDYREPGACVAAVTFHAWKDASAAGETVIYVPEVEPYVPGEFFRRELPCLMAVLQILPEMEVIVIDGYVWLDEGRSGLGAHLHEAFGKRVPVIGVAKTRYRDSAQVSEVFRGESENPLLVTAAGMPVDVAAGHVREMNGYHRIPTLLKRVDQLCRRHPMP